MYHYFVVTVIACYLSICFLLYLSICFLLYLSICFLLYLSICFLLYLSICFLLYLSICFLLYLSICFLLYLSICFLRTKDWATNSNPKLMKVFLPTFPWPVCVTFPMGLWKCACHSCTVVTYYDPLVVLYPITEVVLKIHIQDFD
jgi:hypothetical protein